MKYRLKTTLFVSFAALALSACGQDDKTPTQNPSEDHGHHTTNNETPDQGPSVEDHGGHEQDMADPTDLGKDQGDADMGPTEEDMGPCDEVTLAATQIAINEGVADGTLSAEAVGDGSTRLTIDASAGGAANAAASSYLYIDLGTGQKVDLSDKDAHASSSWHIAVKRTEIRVNSADSGPGNLMVTKVEGTTYEEAALADPRNATWATDDFVDEQCQLVTFGQGMLQTAFAQWYNYDPATHAVSAPEDVVYILYDATTHAAFKLQIEAYASGAHTWRVGPLGGGQP